MGQALSGVPGTGSVATVLGAAAGAILKPSQRLRAPGVVLVPDRRGLRWAAPLAGWERAKEKPGGLGRARWGWC